MTGDVVNDFCIQAATVNGSGSQSSNLVITKALFHMGIPVAAKNVFPSNIEGQPTWYDIRVTPQGHQARKRTVDILIAMNPATWERDAANVRPGGAVIHEATFPRLGAAARDDVSWYPVPFARLAREKLEAKPDLRKYLQNMIYVGVLAELIGLDPAAIERGVRDQFRTKPKAADLNLDAIRIGVDYTRETLVKSDPFRVAPMDGTRGLVLLDGNHAAALGSLMAGCTVLAWYPITPSSSLCEAFIDYAERFRVDPSSGERRFAAIQAEDELAAIGIVLGAGWAGARAMTATSGPGISLMAELTGLGYYAEIPAVIFDIQRVGPSTGLPTRTMQGDVSFVHTLSHGDTRHPVLLPGTVTEVYEDAQRAFDLAERLQTPVFVLSDLDLGMNQWMTPPLAYPEGAIDRGKVLDAKALAEVGHWARYRDVDGDGIPYRTLPGTPDLRAGLLHPRLGPRRERALHREPRRLPGQHGPAAPQDRRSPDAAAGPDRRRGGQPGRDPRLRHHPSRGGRGPRAARRPRHRDRLPPHPRPAPASGGRRVHRPPRTGLRGRAEPGRPGRGAAPPGAPRCAGRPAPEHPPLQRRPHRRRGDQRPGAGR